MAKKEILSSLLGRKVKLGWSVTQANEWGLAHPGEHLNCKLVPAIWRQYGQREAEIVNIYLSDGKPYYDVEIDGNIIVGLAAEINFDLLPKI